MFSPWASLSYTRLRRKAEITLLRCCISRSIHPVVNCPFARGISVSRICKASNTWASGNPASRYICCARNHINCSVSVNGVTWSMMITYHGSVALIRSACMRLNHGSAVAANSGFAMSARGPVIGRTSYTATRCGTVCLVR